MVKFEGNINGKVYTDEKEFNEALSKIDKEDGLHVSYRYVSVPGIFDEETRDNRNFIDYNNSKNQYIRNITRYVSKDQYERNITNENDVIPDDELISKLKQASNKTEIKRDLYNKIDDLTLKISSNLVHLNELKSDYKKLEDKINSINAQIKIIESQVKTLEDANNNYYLNKEYYTIIVNKLEEPQYSDSQEEKEICERDCKCDGKCKCQDKNEFELDGKIVNKTREIFDKFDNANFNIHKLSDLVEYFLNK
jgi:hypothetical protein